MHVPKVSVLIPTYNYARYIGEAIDSVLEQTFSDFEIIIVDNCSTDNTQEIVELYLQRDKRVKYYRNDTNIGAERNFNQCLLYANGEFIKFLNADDKFAPSILEKFVNILENDPTISIVTSYRKYIGLKNDVLIAPFKGKVDAKTAIFYSLAKGNWIGEHTTVMFRRRNLNLGLFDISLVPFSDHDLWLRQLRVGDIYVVDEVLSYFRIHENQGTVQISNAEEKQIYVLLQLTEYRRNAIINNRYGHILNSEECAEIDAIVSVYQRALKKLLKKQSPSLNFLMHVNSKTNLMSLLIIRSLPYFVFKISNAIVQMRRSLKNYFLGKQ